MDDWESTSNIEHSVDTTFTHDDLASLVVEVPIEEPESVTEQCDKS